MLSTASSQMRLLSSARYLTRRRDRLRMVSGPRLSPLVPWSELAARGWTDYGQRAWPSWGAAGRISYYWSAALSSRGEGMPPKLAANAANGFAHPAPAAASATPTKPQGRCPWSSLRDSLAAPYS